jgi:hypothetical protein
VQSENVKKHTVWRKRIRHLLISVFNVERLAKSLKVMGVVCKKANLRALRTSWRHPVLQTCTHRCVFNAQPIS